MESLYSKEDIKSVDDLEALLKRPFEPNDILWRVSRAGSNSKGVWAKVLAYVDSRAIQERLDALFGIDGWEDDYKEIRQGGIVCNLRLKIGDEWVTKSDGAQMTQVESVKGGISDALKRTAVKFGVGRYLYNLSETWADIDDNGELNGQYKDGGQTKYFNYRRPNLPKFARPKPPIHPKMESWDKALDFLNDGGDIQVLMDNYFVIPSHLVLLKEALDDLNS